MTAVMRLTALATFLHGYRVVGQGDDFDAAPSVGRQLIALGHAKEKVDEGALPGVPTQTVRQVAHPPTVTVVQTSAQVETIVAAPPDAMRAAPEVAVAPIPIAVASAVSGLEPQGVEVGDTQEVRPSVPVPNEGGDVMPGQADEMGGVSSRADEVAQKVDGTISSELEPAGVSSPGKAVTRTRRSS